jgi:hypothetical protein
MRACSATIHSHTLPPAPPRGLCRTSVRHHIDLATCARRRPSVRHHAHFYTTVPTADAAHLAARATTETPKTALTGSAQHGGADPSVRSATTGAHGALTASGPEILFPLSQHIRLGHNKRPTSSAATPRARPRPAHAPCLRRRHLDRDGCRPSLSVVWRTARLGQSSPTPTLRPLRSSVRPRSPSSAAGARPARAPHAAATRLTTRAVLDSCVAQLRRGHGDRWLHSSFPRGSRTA